MKREGRCALEFPNLHGARLPGLIGPARNESEEPSKTSGYIYHRSTVIYYCKVFSHTMISPSIIRTALPPFRLAAFPTSKALLTVTSYHTRQLSTSSLCRNSLSAKQSHQEATSRHRRARFKLVCIHFIW